MSNLQTGPPGLDEGTTANKVSDPAKLGGDETGSKTQETAEENWVPSKHEKAIIYTLAFLNLIVSLDATIVVTCLAVNSSLAPRASSPPYLY